MKTSDASLRPVVPESLARPLPKPLHRGAVLALIQKDPNLIRLYREVCPRLSTDPGHDLEHALRVVAWTLHLAPECPRAEAVAAGLLHDLVNLPKNSPERALASQRSAEQAERLLPDFGFASDSVTRVTEAVLDHSYSRGRTPRSPLGRALQDADRLEALGVLGLFRTISTGALMGAEYFHASDPWAEQRELDDLRFSVDHFFTKLLRLPQTFNTSEGRREAQRRVARLRRVLCELGEEIGSPCDEALLDARLSDL